jgi:hypothetical protein
VVKVPPFVKRETVRRMVSKEQIEPTHDEIVEEYLKDHLSEFIEIK